MLSYHIFDRLSKYSAERMSVIFSSTIFIKFTMCYRDRFCWTSAHISSFLHTCECFDIFNKFIWAIFFISLTFPIIGQHGHVQEKNVRANMNTKSVSQYDADMQCKCKRNIVVIIWVFAVWEMLVGLMFHVLPWFLIYYILCIVYIYFVTFLV